MWLTLLYSDVVGGFLRVSSFECSNLVFSLERLESESEECVAGLFWISFIFLLERFYEWTAVFKILKFSWISVSVVYWAKCILIPHYGIITMILLLLWWCPAGCRPIFGILILVTVELFMMWVLCVVVHWCLSVGLCVNLVKHLM